MSELLSRDNVYTFCRPCVRESSGFSSIELDANLINSISLPLHLRTVRLSSDCASAANMSITAVISESDFAVSLSN